MTTDKTLVDDVREQMKDVNLNVPYLSLRKEIVEMFAALAEVEQRRGDQLASLFDRHDAAVEKMAAGA